MTLQQAYTAKVSLRPSVRTYGNGQLRPLCQRMSKDRQARRVNKLRTKRLSQAKPPIDEVSHEDLD